MHLKTILKSKYIYHGLLHLLSSSLYNIIVSSNQPSQSSCSRYQRHSSAHQSPLPPISTAVLRGHYYTILQLYTNPPHFLSLNEGSVSTSPHPPGYLRHRPRHRISCQKSCLRGTGPGCPLALPRFRSYTLSIRHDSASDLDCGHHQG